MRAVVVYESMFGNTERVARAVGEGLSRYADVAVREVGDADPDVGAVDLLVLGGPTHAFGMSRRNTRADAERQGADRAVAGDIGVREWLELMRCDGTVPVAVFDTKVPKARRLPGAARGAGRGLRRRGHRLVVPPETFLVADTPGPLLDGELDRAARWGAAIGASVAAATPDRRPTGDSRA